MAVDTSNITDWLLIEEAEELFGMKPTALRHTPIATRYRPKNTGVPITQIPSERTPQDRPRDDERYYTVEQVRQIYGLSSANICHIVR